MGRPAGRHGHPQPYGLNHIEFGNEEGPTAEHAEKFKAVARAVWAKHPEVVFVMGDSRASDENDEKLDRLFRPSEPIGRKVPLAADLLRFARAQGKADQFWWDLHYNAPANIAELYRPLAPYDGLQGAVRFRNEALKLAPDCKFQLALLEENGVAVPGCSAPVPARNHHAIARTGGGRRRRHGGELPPGRRARPGVGPGQDLLQRVGRLAAAALLCGPDD